MINYIKVQKDHDDYNVIVSFSGRNEWSTIQYLIERAYVDRDDLAKEDRSGKFNEHAAERLFDDMAEMSDIIYYE